MTTRPTLTLRWEGKTARLPDITFYEVVELVVEHVAPTPAPEPPKEIGLRLENWARWASAPSGGGGASCVTGAICDKLRKEAEGSPPSHQWRHAIDNIDAARIEVAMRALNEADRLLLNWCYIEQERPDFIMRKMSIPKADFVPRFRAAQAAIEVLANNQGVK